jgi:hypothetical protein
MNGIKTLCSQHKKLIAMSATALFAVAAAPAHAAPGVPLTSELTLESSPDFTLLAQAARDSAGDFAVVYFDGNNGNILQTFHVNGTPYSSRINVSKSYDVAVGIDKDGDLAVAWVEPESDYSQFHLMTQRYALDGTAKGSPVEVTAPFKRFAPDGLDVAMDDDGDFAVKWTKPWLVASYLNPYQYISAETASIYVRVFKADGSARTRAVWVETDPVTIKHAERADSASSSLAMDAAGNITVAWAPYFGASLLAQKKIQARRFDVNGKPLGTKFTVASSWTHQLVRPVVSADAAGDFAVAWADSLNFNQTDYANDIGIQRYSSSGTPAGAALAIAQQPGLTQVSLSMDRAGDFAVQWATDEFTDTRHGKLFAQYYAADGSILAPTFQINSTDFQDVMPNQVLLDGSGGLLSVWNGATPEVGGPGSDIVIYGRLFSGPN